MKWVWNVIGVVLILAGGTFALQGLNVLLGSFMSGRTEWLIIGAAMVVVGVGVLFLGNWRPRRTGRP
jgi:hypothetical protein